MVDPAPPAPYTLACDYGSLWTKATLFGPVGTGRRLIAATSVPTPHRGDGEPDLPSATRLVGEWLHARTGIPASAADGPEESSYDTRASLVPLGSAARRLDVVAVVPDRGATVRVAALLRSASYMGSIRVGTVQELLAASGAADPRPDAVVLVEGKGGYAARDVQPLALLLARLGADTRLVRVLHCTPEGAASAASSLLTRMDTDAIPADLLGRASEGASQVRRALNVLYGERSLARAGRTLDLPSDRQTRWVSTVGSQAISARFAASGDASVLVLDVGATSTSACYASGDNLRYGVLSGIGLGVGAAALYARAGEQNLKRWLPFEPEPDELRHWAMNRTLEPLAVAATVREAMIEQAYAREALHLAIEDLSLPTPPTLVLGCGALARGMRPQAAVALLVDALNLGAPAWQRTDIAVDTSNVVGALGALAAADPELAAQVWQADAPRIVATALAARGAKRGAPALQAVLHQGEEGHPLAIAGGSLVRLEAPYGEVLRVELTPSRGVKLPGASGNQPLVEEIAPTSAYPLPQLLVDARPPQPPPPAQRAAAVAEGLVHGGVFPRRVLEGLR